MICLILFIFTISSVSATDANQTENILTTDIGTFSELHDTINNAENGSTVNLDKDYVYNGGDGGEGINITKDITINGNGHILDGNHASRIFSIDYANVVLKNITFVNAKSIEGGAINSHCFDDNFNDYNNLEINNCIFEGNTADVGGAVYAYFNNLKINDCIFANNIAAKNGGAIELLDSNALINNSLFLNNLADNGAAIRHEAFFYINDIVISNTILNDNVANVDFGLVDTYGVDYVYGDVYLRSHDPLADHQIDVTPSDTSWLYYPNLTFVNVSFNGIENQSFIFNEDDLNANMDNETIRFEVYGDDVLLINTTNITHDGIARIDYGNLSVANNYTLKVYYRNLTDSDLLRVKKDPNFTMSVENILYGEDVVINFDISSEIENYENAQGSVQIWDASTYGHWDIPDYAGDFYFKDKTISIDFLNLGSFVAVLDFNGDDTFYSKRIHQIFNITYYNETAKQTVIDVEPFEKYFGDDKRLSFNLTDENGTGIAGKEINIRINGVDYKRTTDEFGCFSMAINLGPGDYPANFWFNGDGKYLPASAYCEVRVLVFEHSSVIATEPLKKYYGDTKRLSFNQTDEEGTGIAGEEIQISINGVVYYRTTDELGSASMAINLDPGIYDADLLFDGDDYYSYAYSTVEIEILSTISCLDMQKYVGTPDRFTVSCLDSKGNKLTSGDVEFNINGVKYQRPIQDGIAGLNINLDAGVYIITATNPSTAEMNSSVITVLPTLINNYDLVKFYRNDSQFTVDLVGVEDNKNQTVTFNINGVMYERKTNENGTAKLNINLAPGNYIITSMYNGCMVSNEITVLPILEAEDLVMQYRDGSTFDAMLLDGQGNPLKNTNVTFNINGVFYNRTTDENGIARLNINLMSGEYIITSMYNGCNIANRITIV